ncbi:DUF4244 domain-containing protein [Paenarthrobacter sp. DKR-5]|uniref:DUF4244 domain-containing protein n=1 Tax=Paenarthrobacter sp. DKR-5 TaxID=2835535 RepID=UPI001BDC770A|nr:DUF4244 domain-containing protein [Paenarthrobacter sp. DKR-5]MBT1001334.1 DUF4244 domain-containing protein [Paenarthrobacter sp. DKR-5]
MSVPSHPSAGKTLPVTSDLPGVRELFPGALSRRAVRNSRRVRRSLSAHALSARGLSAPALSPRRPRVLSAEAGMATAEYAIATLAAVGFAGLLVVILRSDEVRGFLLNVIRSALSLQ